MAQDLLHLVVKAPGKPAQTVPLAGPLSIGSSPECDLCLDDPLARQVHAQIRLNEQGVALYTRGAPITVDGAPWQSNGPLALRPGVTFGIGEVRLAVVEPGTAPADGLDARRNPAQQDPPQGARPAPALRLTQPPESDPPLAPGPTSRYLRYLPAIFQDEDLPSIAYPNDEARSFLGRYLLIFESIWEQLEQRQDFIDLYFHPATSPNSFVGWLAGWFGIVVGGRIPDTHRRRLVAELYELYRWRGTRYGLQRLLEICVGARPEITDATSAGEPGAPDNYVFTVAIRLPPKSEITRELIVELIETHKPAHAGFVLELSQ